MSKLSALSLSDTPYKMPVINPKTGVVMKTNEENPREAFIMVKSISSVEANDFKRRTYEEARKSRKRKELGMPYDEVIDRTAEMLAELTTGWFLVDFNGEVIDEPFSFEAAKRIYSEPPLDWLRRQVDEAVNDDANFTPS